MTVLSPVIYQFVSQRLGLPPLEQDPTEALFERSPVLVEFLSERWEEEWSNTWSELIRPVSLTQAFEGLAGIPLLDDTELEGLLQDAEPGATEPHQDNAWWDFRCTGGRQWAMFPGNANDGWQVSVMLPAVDGSDLRLHVLQAEVDFAARPATRPALPVSPGPCVHEVHQDEPGAPYRGRCRNDGCPAGCRAQVVLHPEEGLYRLMGCSC